MKLDIGCITNDGFEYDGILAIIGFCKTKPDIDSNNLHGVLL